VEADLAEADDKKKGGEKLLNEQFKDL